MLNKIIKFFLENKLVTLLMLTVLIAWGIVVAPFGWKVGALPSDPVPVDAIPDIGENQQIVFTEWAGQSPQDIEDQISYPLTTYLLGIPGVKSIRSSSIFGFSSIYIIFNEDIDFYWSRSRILEKLNALPAGLLPNNVQPALGPDATALGQVYWYTLEGRDSLGNVTGGWDLDEIRSVQDYFVKYNLNAVEGVSEVASIGGYVKEYQIDVNPDALKTYNIPLHKVMQAVQQTNKDVGAKTVEINQAEYLVRGLGYIQNLEDIEQTVVTVEDNTPITVKDIAKVTLGPANRRGLLDKGGAEVVGGVVVARYGANPMKVIQQVKTKIAEIENGLPQKTLKDGTVSQLYIVPFYDRSTLIQETLGTLEEALTLEILISILVVIVMVYNLRASLLISSLLPIAVLMVFIAMKYVGIDANIVALSGIAIAIGTMVDLGIILSENIIKHLDENKSKLPLKEIVYNASTEVATAIITAVATTIVSFIPVFTLQEAEGKLFGPLAFTKTFALLAALLVALLVLPTFAHWFFGWRIQKSKFKTLVNSSLAIIGIVLLILGFNWPGAMLLAFGCAELLTFSIKKYTSDLPAFVQPVLQHLSTLIAIIGVITLLSNYWLPLGPGKSNLTNFFFVALLVGLILGFFKALEHFYANILKWALHNKVLFFSFPLLLIFFAVNIWMGFNTTFGWIANGAKKVGISLEETNGWKTLSNAFPGIGQEFMPSLNEGSFLLMPTSMPHAGVEYNRKVVGQLDQLVAHIPEIETVVGKAGRVSSALDPAPVSMYENIINYKPEFILDAKGHRQRFKTDKNQRFILTYGDTLSNEKAIVRGIKAGQLIPDEDGQFFRNWREQIQSPDDIWNEIVKVTKIPGITSAPKLQPIETRLVMLQTGMRAPMGIKVFGPDLETIQQFGLELEDLLKTVPSVKKEAVFADRIVGKPYLQIRIDRSAIARYGLTIDAVQQTIQTAIGGSTVTTTIEGRERYNVRIRYPRELRENPEVMETILVATSTGVQIPLKQLATIEYTNGPQAIKSENTFLVGYVLFDKQAHFSEVEVVNAAQSAIQNAIDHGELTVPSGVSYRFSGNYENQVRAQQRLSIIVPLVLGIVFLILFFQFRSVTTSLMVFSGIAVAFAGAFMLLWLYGKPWFFNIELFDVSMRDLFQMQTVNLSVAVWVGFIALFGIATDDGVLIATYLDQQFKREKPQNREEVHQAVIHAGLRRIRPALMTVSTTMIALLPVLTSTGKGSDIMVPMAIPTFGGMAFALITVFIVPVLYSIREERNIKKSSAS